MSRFDGIPKLHMASHYPHSICELSTPDGYNTELPENLHIHYTKKPYRASNGVDPFPQMIQYVQWQEGLHIHKVFLNECYGPHDQPNSDDESNDEGGEFEDKDKFFFEAEEDEEGDDRGNEFKSVHEGGQGHNGGHMDVDNEADFGSREGTDITLDASPVHYPSPNFSITQQPTQANVCRTDIIQTYGATDFILALCNCLSLHFDIPRDEQLLSPLHSFNVWHRFALHHHPLPFVPGEAPKCDVVHAQPPVGQCPGEFDTVLFVDPPKKSGLECK